ncbi:hypothetical protein TRFO_21757 [Tritrichomonas foetus]|uniref:Uncharacterized protein n=1 Tax=Tritrichomonas foetus TaxID=1144522 RepID=A0A1J4KD61_9EUKA|nr:hypothetical protein TRFO_21757 [Tritrichomonas foetus]|eukprot:OHT09361.1 hypothetical protein TRFO_21757 [Tritrichomonas foetus]
MECRNKRQFFKENILTQKETSSMIFIPWFLFFSLLEKEIIEEYDCLTGGKDNPKECIIENQMYSHLKFSLKNNINKIIFVKCKFDNNMNGIPILESNQPINLFITSCKFAANGPFFMLQDFGGKISSLIINSSNFWSKNDKIPSVFFSNIILNYHLEFRHSQFYMTNKNYSFTITLGDNMIMEKCLFINKIPADGLMNINTKENQISIVITSCNFQAEEITYSLMKTSFIRIINISDSCFIFIPKDKENSCIIFSNPGMTLYFYGNNTFSNISSRNIYSRYFYIDKDAKMLYGQHTSLPDVDNYNYSATSYSTSLFSSHPQEIFFYTQTSDVTHSGKPENMKEKFVFLLAILIVIFMFIFLILLIYAIIFFISITRSAYRKENIKTDNVILFDEPNLSDELTPIDLNFIKGTHGKEEEIFNEMNSFE